MLSSLLGMLAVGGVTEEQKYMTIKLVLFALAGVAHSWFGVILCTKRLLVGFLVGAHAQVEGSVSGRGRQEAANRCSLARPGAFWSSLLFYGCCFQLCTRQWQGLHGYPYTLSIVNYWFLDFTVYLKQEKQPCLPRSLTQGDIELVCT